MPIKTIAHHRFYALREDSPPDAPAPIARTRERRGAVSTKMPKNQGSYLVQGMVLTCLLV